MQHSVSPLLALLYGLLLVAAFAAALRYWHLEPVKAQKLARRMTASALRATKLAYRIVCWPANLLVKWAILIAAAPVYTFLAMSWVLLMKVAGHKAKITVKFS